MGKYHQVTIVLKLRAKKYKTISCEKGILTYVDLHSFARDRAVEFKKNHRIAGEKAVVREEVKTAAARGETPTEAVTTRRRRHISILSGASAV